MALQRFDFWYQRALTDACLRRLEPRRASYIHTALHSFGVWYQPSGSLTLAFPFVRFTALTCGTSSFCARGTFLVGLTGRGSTAALPMTN